MQKRGLLETLKRTALSGVIVAAGVVGIMKHDGVQAKVAGKVPVLKKVLLPEIQGNTFSEAFKEARLRGLKTFVWSKNGKVYTTEYKGSAKEQMEKYGIVNDQLQDRSWWKDRLIDNLNPGGYHAPWERVWDAIVLNKKDSERKPDRISREDYYSIYMGRPQQHNTLGISDYTPANVEEVNGKKLPASSKIIYKDNRLSQYLTQCWAIYAKHLLSEPNHRESRIMHKDLYHFKMSLGHDEQGDYICYHDTWNIAPLGPTTDFGKPFEIYDRIYFDMEKLDEAFQKQKKIAREFNFEDEILPLTVDGVRRFKNGSREEWWKDLVEQRMTITRVDKYGYKRSGVVQGAQGNIIETIKYKTDEKRRLLGEVHRDSSGKIIEEREYVLDAKGRLIKEIQKNDVGFESVYVYDASGDGVGRIRRLRGVLLDGYGDIYEQALEQEHRMSKTSAKKQSLSNVSSETRGGRQGTRTHVVPNNRDSGYEI